MVALFCVSSKKLYNSTCSFFDDVYRVHQACLIFTVRVYIYLLNALNEEKPTESVYRTGTMYYTYMYVHTWHKMYVYVFNV